MANIIHKRKITDEIIKYLKTDDIIILQGARQVGKTSILSYLASYLEQQGSATHYLDLEDSRLVSLLDQGVEAFIKYLQEKGLVKMPVKRSEQTKLYVLLDEIQYLDKPSEFLKLIADHHRYLKLIVSGSSTLAMKKKFQDSLAGRTVNFEIFNLSFAEFLEFKQYPFVSDRRGILSETDIKIAELQKHFQEYATYGGYPKVVLTTEADKKEKYVQQIIDTYLRKDIKDLAEVKELDKFNKLLEILASQSGNLVNITELANTTGLAKQTVEHYLFILEQTYVIKLVKPFNRNLRSELFKTPKIYFFDSGLQQLLWLKSFPKQILGNVFETAIFAELVKHYGQDNIRYWRTTDKKEIDFVLQRKNQLVLIEAKLSFVGFKSTAMDYFRRHYPVADFFVTSLAEAPADQHFRHPWSLGQ